MTSSGEVWVQWFTCCLSQQGTGVRNKRQRPQQRVRIDRSMISAPTNFQHTGHIGSCDLDNASTHLSAIETQMQGKGGYEASFEVKKTATELYRLLRESYGEYASLQDTRERWFQRFKSGDFDVDNKKDRKPPERVGRYRIASMKGRKRFTNTRTTRKTMYRLATSCLRSSTRYGKYLEGRQMDTT